MFDRCLFNRINIIGGPGRTGETLNAEMLAAKLGPDVRVISGGDRQRALAIANGYIKGGHRIQDTQNPTSAELSFADTVAFNRFCLESGRKNDREVDVWLMREMLRALDTTDPSNPTVIIASKVMAALLASEDNIHLAESVRMAQLSIAEQVSDDDLEAFVAKFGDRELGDPLQDAAVTTTIESLRGSYAAVWIDCDLEIRACRGLEKLGIVHASFGDPETSAGEYARRLEAEQTDLTQRQSKDGERYRQVYGILNYPEPDLRRQGVEEFRPTPFGIIVYSDETPEIVFDKVCCALQRAPLV